MTTPRAQATPDVDRRELVKLRQFETVGILAHAVLGVSLAVVAYFFADVFGQIRSLQESRYDHETRLRLIDYRLIQAETKIAAKE